MAAKRAFVLKAAEYSGGLYSSAEGVLFGTAIGKETCVSDVVRTGQNALASRVSSLKNTLRYWQDPILRQRSGKSLLDKCFRAVYHSASRKAALK